MEDPAAWIALAALLLSVVMGAAGFLRHPALVPAHAVKDLRAEIAQLERRVEELERANATLTQQNQLIISEREWWREQYRTVKTELDGRKFGADG